MEGAGVAAVASEHTLATRSKPGLEATLGYAATVKTRDAGLDLLRLVAIVAVVAGHTWDEPLVRQVLYPWHVPIFFFLAGYLWTPGRTVRDELGRRGRSLAKPYAFWWLVLFAMYVPTLALTGDLSPARLLAPIWGGVYAKGPFTTFWFVSVLFIAALLWRVLERTPRIAQVAVVAIGTLAGVIFGQYLAMTPLSVGTALPALLFVVAGQVARRHAPRGRVLPAVLAALTVALLIGLAAQGAYAPFDLKRGDWGTPGLTIVASLLICWALVVLAERVGPLLGRMSGTISLLAMTGLTIVLVHPPIVWVLQSAGVPLPLIFVAALSVPCAVGLIALRLPVSQWVTGTARRTHDRQIRDRIKPAQQDH